MIKAAELRIGNYLCQGSKQEPESYYEGTVSDIYEDENVYWDYDGASNGSSKDSLSKLSPVPLSEEWLQRFGFIRQTLEYDEQGRSIEVRFSKVTHAVVWPAEGNSEYYNIPVPCQYVHQLQNLYFALTGKDLKMK